MGRHTKSFLGLSCQWGSEQRGQTVTHSTASSTRRYLAKSHADFRQTASVVCLVSGMLAGSLQDPVARQGHTGSVWGQRDFVLDLVFPKVRLGFAGCCGLSPNTLEVSWTLSVHFFGLWIGAFTCSFSPQRLRSLGM